jgi:hypothetical protein
MKAEIALATVSGRAYYKLVSELKRRNTPFLSLKPMDAIPLDIRVIITTKEERQLVTHPNVLIFEEEKDSAEIVNEAIRLVHGKSSYEKLVIGVDPGRTFGVAIIGDGKVLETVNCSSIKETLKVILKALDRLPAIVSRVKIGDGATIYAKELLQSLDKALPTNASMEIVCEAGTSHPTKGTTHQREMKDAMSAIKIAGREGRIFLRKNPR